MPVIRPVIHSATPVPLTFGGRPVTADLSRGSASTAAAGTEGSSGHSVWPQPATARTDTPQPTVPAWPDPAVIYLAGELLKLSTTTIATTATITLPDTGADFWSMLETALPEVKGA